MDRRTFLRLSAAGATAAALSTWLSGCADHEEEGKVDDSVAQVAGSRHLKQAWQAARRTGRPLLVIVESPNDAHRTSGGVILGPAIQHADDVMLADLATCEVVCTTVADLARAVPAAAKLGSPWLFLVEWDGDAPTTHPVPLAFDDLADPEKVFDEIHDYNAASAAAEKAMRARFARIADVLHNTLAADEPMLERRAAANLAALGSGVWQRTEASVRAGKVPMDADILAAGPLLRLEAERDPARPFTHVLAAARARTLKEAPPPGARWATNVGCGILVDGDPAPGYACGMGHVPPLSDRFLTYYAEE